MIYSHKDGGEAKKKSPNFRLQTWAKEENLASTLDAERIVYQNIVLSH